MKKSICLAVGLILMTCFSGIALPTGDKTPSRTATPNPLKGEAGGPITPLKGHSVWVRTNPDGRGHLFRSPKVTPTAEPIKKGHS